MPTDQTLNIALFVFHTSWMIFNCVGWVFQLTRRWHLVTVVLTGLSWFVLGIWYGWGYCPFTDWHWRVRARLGHSDPTSYLQLLATELFGLELDLDLANALAVGTLLAAGVLTTVLNIRDLQRNR